MPPVALDFTAPRCTQGLEWPKGKRHNGKVPGPRRPSQVPGAHETPRKFAADASALTHTVRSQHASVNRGPAQCLWFCFVYTHQNRVPFETPASTFKNRVPVEEKRAFRIFGIVVPCYAWFTPTKQGYPTHQADRPAWCGCCMRAGFKDTPTKSSTL